MKLLFDGNLSPRLAKDLEALFPGSRHVDQADLHGQPDGAVWEYAPPALRGRVRVEVLAIP